MKKQKENNIFIKTGFTLLVIALFILAGCEQGPGGINGPGGNAGTSNSFDSEIKTQTFKSSEEYRNFLKDNAGNDYYYYGSGMRNFAMAEDSMGATLEMATVSKSMDGSSGAPVPDFSGTNNQVQNVDEGDILKTDGEYIYTITGKTLFIIKAYPGEDAEVVSQIELKGTPQGLFVEGNQLAVFGDFYDLDFFRETKFTPRNGMTFFNIYDISDKEEPSLEKEFKFEGRYFDSRMKDGIIYFVSAMSPEYRTIDPMPMMMEGTTKTSLMPTDIYYYNINYDSPFLVMVSSINLEDEEKLETKAITVEGNQEMYMSANNIYLTYTKYINEWEIQQDITINLLKPLLTEEDQKLIEKIENADSELLSNMEKKAKIMNIIYSYQNILSQEEQEELQTKAEQKLKEEMQKYEHLEYTIVNKISVDKGKIKADANGKVPGHIMNQFSMDENEVNGEEYFRIATTISQRWNRWLEEDVVTAESDVAVAKIMPPRQQTESSNNVYVLDSNLGIVGELEGLADGEQIFSTRFIGDKLYMVTFRQVDPFFVIDLSNPEKPKDLGELKIPGFSRYLHPYDENTIIGIGRDASETGRQQGLKISLFDVSDVENPKEIAKYVSEDTYASSNAEWEHKAFLFSKDKELLVIPVSNYGWQDQENNYNGAFVFKITKDSIKLRGLIDHSEGTQGWYSPSVERSLYINELLYTKSPNLLRINALEDLESVNKIKLEAKYSGDIIVY